MPAMARRPPGEGTIDWRTIGGQRRARVRLRTGDGLRRAFMAPPEVQSDADAEAFRIALVVQLSGTPHDPRLGGATLGAYGLRWLEQRERTHADAAGDAQRWGAYIAGTRLASMRLRSITPSDVRAFGRDLVALEIARQTARNAWTTLRACLRAAGEGDLVDVAPLLAVELPRGRAADHVQLEEAVDILTCEEIGAVLALDLTDEQRSAFLVGVLAGLRAGELHGLTWDRVVLDEARPELVVARSRRGATKGGKVVRVPLFEPARRALQERWDRAGRPSAGLVWPGPKGGCHARGFDWGWSTQPERRPLSSLPLLRARERKGELRIVKRERDAVLVAFPGIREHAGIARAITWHAATRHTCASHLLMGSWAPEVVPRAYRMEEVSRMLRHSSIAVTERYYARFTIDALPGAVRRGPGAGPVGPGSAVFQATSGIRTPDLRFTKPSRDARDHEGNEPSGTQGERAAAVLRAIAEGRVVGVDAEGQRAVHDAITLCAAIVEREERAVAVGGDR